MLQPSSPAKMIDKMFLESVLQNGIGPNGDVWFAPSRVQVDNQIVVFGSLFVANLNSDWSILPFDMGYQNNDTKFFVSESNQTLTIQKFSQDTPLNLKVRYFLKL